MTEILLKGRKTITHQSIQRYYHFYPYRNWALLQIQHHTQQPLALPSWSVRVAERLALPTSDHGVVGSNPAGGAILPEPKRHFIAQSLSSSPFHRPEMTEILLKGRKSLTHPSILPSSSSTPKTTHPNLYPILPLSLLKFGRNDSRPKRPRAETTHLLRPKRPTPKIGRNDPGRNDPAETTQGRNDPDSISRAEFCLFWSFSTDPYMR